MKSWTLGASVSNALAKNSMGGALWHFVYCNAKGLLGTCGANRSERSTEIRSLKAGVASDMLSGHPVREGTIDQAMDVFERFKTSLLADLDKKCDDFKSALKAELSSRMSSPLANVEDLTFAQEMKMLSLSGRAIAKILRSFKPKSKKAIV